MSERSKNPYSQAEETAPSDLSTVGISRPKTLMAFGKLRLAEAEDVDAKFIAEKRQHFLKMLDTLDHPLKLQ